MANDDEASNQKIGDAPQFAPGVLCPVEFTREPAVKLSDSQKNALKDLDKKISKRDLPARREQILDAWEARMFKRGVQHLLWSGVTRGWELPQPGSGYHPQDTNSRSMFDVNIYSSYAEIITAALTREFPTVRTKPSDSDEDIDVTAAQTAEKLIDEIKRKASGMKSLMADEASLLWTDGLCLKYSRYELDAQQFGYNKPEEGVVPEDEDSSDQVQPENQEIPSAASNGEDGALGVQAATRGTPRGWQVTTGEGALEWQLPIKANCLDECDWARRGMEYSSARMKAKYPDIADKIETMATAPGGDEIDRLARINTKIGVRNTFLTADSQAYDVTETTLFLRPATLFDIPDAEIRNSLLEICGECGLKVVFAGAEVAACWKISMNDQLSLTFALPGDGMHRLALGTKLIPIQKVLNNWIDLLDDYLVRGVPMKWGDSQIFDKDKISSQANVPGGWNNFAYPPGLPPGTPVNGVYFFEETMVEPPQTLLGVIQYVMNEVSQLLTGAFPALFGGDTESNDTMGGIMIQRDQALGRLGITWRFIKEGYAKSIMQMVRSIAKNHDGIVKTTGSEALTIEMGQLKGNFLCYPDTDENFPETYTQIQNRMMMLLQDAMTSPMIMQFLDDVENLQVVKDAIGLQNLKIPMVASRDQQLGEIDILLKSGPAPNPEYLAAQQSLQRFATEAQLNPRLAAELPKAQQQAAAIPQEVSTVQVHEWDDHATHISVCEAFFRSSRGRALENGDEQEQLSFQNIVAHWREHKAALAQKQPMTPSAPPKPLSLSANVKDLPPVTAAAAIAKTGLPANPEDFAAQGVVKAQEQHPALDLQEKGK